MLRLSCHLALFTSIAAAQATAPRVELKLHAHLRDQLAAGPTTGMLPVYFVVGDKLAYSHFFPRVLHMDKATRRATVVRELQEHMLETQSGLWDVLAREVRAGRVEVVSRNWLGNFVRVRATPDAILAAAAVDAVTEVWADVRYPEASLQDEVAPSAPPVAPGNGPLDTKANLVWAKGITGQGIVWMNSDQGVRVNNTNPSDVHPALAGKLWQNPGEIAGNNIDDDNNGKIDDHHGWNFDLNNLNVDDGGGHGTNCAGVFVAVEHTNNDTLGNCPDARLMCAALNAEASMWDALQYAVAEGADGQTSSYSYKNNFSPPPNYKMHRDVGETTLAAGLIRTNSTSNNGTSCTGTSTVRRPFNIAAPGCLPAPWTHPDQLLLGRPGGVLGIGAHNVGLTTQPSYTPCGPFAWLLADVQVVLPTYPIANWDAINDNDYPWQAAAQIGLLKPDLTGPTGTRTSTGANGYTAFSGTSNATPSVSSCLALALSANPSLTPEDMAMAAQTTAIDYLTAGKDNLSGAGRLDAYELTKMCRAIHRINADVAHTVRVRINTTLSLQLDSIPNTPVALLLGTGPLKQTLGEFTLRVANPVIVMFASTDAAGNFAFSVPVPAAWNGIIAWTQFAVGDTAFGGTTGTASNAIKLMIVP